MNVNFMYVYGEYEHLLYILCPLYVLLLKLNRYMHNCYLYHVINLSSDIYCPVRDVIYCPITNAVLRTDQSDVLF